MKKKTSSVKKTIAKPVPVKKKKKKVDNAYPATTTRLNIKTKL